jgi:nucleotide-binding universal stress UspA family protein
MTKKVLVGAQESPPGLAAIRAAVAKAEAEGAELHLVGYLEPPKGEAGMSSYPREVERLQDQVARLAARLVPEHIATQAHVPTGVTRPSEAILRVAAQEGVDLIVIGMRKRSRVGKLLLGSNAQDILLAAECPVLSVKAGE